MSILNESTMEKIKTADKASISITRVKSTELSLKETESNRVLIAICTVINHTLIDSLSSS